MPFLWLIAFASLMGTGHGTFVSLSCALNKEISETAQETTLAELCGSPSVSIKSISGVGEVTSQKLSLLLSSVSPLLGEDQLEGMEPFIKLIGTQDIPLDNSMDMSSSLALDPQQITFPSECGTYFLIVAFKVEGASNYQISTDFVEIKRDCQNQDGNDLDLMLEVRETNDNPSILVSNKVNIISSGIQVVVKNNGSSPLLERTLMDAVSIVATVSQYYGQSSIYMEPNYRGNRTLQEVSDLVRDMPLGTDQWISGLELSLVSENKEKGKRMEPGEEMIIDLSRLKLQSEPICGHYGMKIMINLYLDPGKEVLDTKRENNKLHLFLLDCPQNYWQSFPPNSDTKCEIFPDVKTSGRNAFIFGGMGGFMYDSTTNGFSRLEYRDEDILKQYIIASAEFREKTSRLASYEGLCPNPPVDDNLTQELLGSPVSEAQKLVQKLLLEVNLIPTQKPKSNEEKGRLVLMLSTLNETLSTFLRTEAQTFRVIFLQVATATIQGLSLRQFGIHLNPPGPGEEGSGTGMDKFGSGNEGSGGETVGRGDFGDDESDEDKEQAINFDDEYSDESASNEDLSSGNECDARCDGGDICYSHSWVCDTIRDCADGSDEADCIDNETPINYERDMASLPSLGSMAGGSPDWSANPLLKPKKVAIVPETLKPEALNSGPGSQSSTTSAPLPQGRSIDSAPSMNSGSDVTNGDPGGLPFPGVSSERATPWNAILENMEEEERRKIAMRRRSRTGPSGGTGNFGFPSEPGYKRNTGQRQSPKSSPPPKQSPPPPPPQNMEKLMKLVEQFRFRLATASTPSDMSEFDFIPASLRQSIIYVYGNYSDIMSFELLTFWREFFENDASQQTLQSLQNFERYVLPMIPMQIGLVKDDILAFLNLLKTNVSVEARAYAGSNEDQEALLDLSLGIFTVVEDNLQDVILLVQKVSEVLIMSPKELSLLKDQPGKEPNILMNCQRSALENMRASEMNMQEDLEDKSPYFDILDTIGIKQKEKPVHWMMYKGGVYIGQRSSLFATMYWDKIAICSCPYSEGYATMNSDPKSISKNSNDFEHISKPDSNDLKGRFSSSENKAALTSSSLIDSDPSDVQIDGGDGIKDKYSSKSGTNRGFESSSKSDAERGFGLPEVSDPEAEFGLPKVSNPRTNKNQIPDQEIGPSVKGMGETIKDGLRAINFPPIFNAVEHLFNAPSTYKLQPLSQSKRVNFLEAKINSSVVRLGGRYKEPRGNRIVVYGVALLERINGNRKERDIGTICDTNWGVPEATIVCKTVAKWYGFELLQSLPLPGEPALETEALEIMPAFKLDQVRCPAEAEDMLLDCSHNGWGVSNCLPYQRAGVKCVLLTN